MASAQQKPKKVKGTRNSNRRNGKAFKQNPFDATSDFTKFTGRSILGYKRSRVEKWAADNGISLHEQIVRMQMKRDFAKVTRKINKADAARLKAIRETPRRNSLAGVL